MKLGKAINADFISSRYKLWREEAETIKTVFLYKEQIDYITHPEFHMFGSKWIQTYIFMQQRL